MGNETEKNFQKQQPTGGSVDQSKQNPSHQGGQSPNQQDQSKKNPMRDDDSRQGNNETGSDQGDKRRAS
jgi:hypothetical protein